MLYKSLLLLGLMLVFIPAILAHQKKKYGHGQNEKHINCTEWTYGACTFKNGATCGAGRKVGNPVNENCPIKQKMVHCKVPCTDASLSPSSSTDCRYKKPRVSKERQMHNCDPQTNKMAITVKLIRGDPASCPPTKVVYEDCKRRLARSAGKSNKRSGGRKQKQTEATTAAAVAASTATETAVTMKSAECKYRKAKGQKPACDPATNTRTVTRQLKKNASGSCEPTKTFTEQCRPAKTKQGGRKSSGLKGL